jgi:hypothetical protein
MWMSNHTAQMHPVSTQMKMKIACLCVEEQQR